MRHQPNVDSPFHVPDPATCVFGTVAATGCDHVHVRQHRSSCCNHSMEKANQKSVWNRGYSFWRPFQFASNILSQDARSVRLEDSIGAMHALATDSISKNSLI